MAALPTILLKPVVRFREFPFGTVGDPSMVEAMAPRPWEHQEKVLQYLRSGLILGVTMGSDLTDWFDPPHKANPVFAGRCWGGTTEMSDGAWFWYAGLVYFIEKYNVRLPDEFVRHAVQQGGRVNRDRIPPYHYVCSYFEQGPAGEEAVANPSIL